MSEAATRLAAIRDDLDNLLEDHISELLAHVKAAQEITRQIAAVEESMAAERDASADASARIEAMRKRQLELLSGLAGLTEGLKG